MKLEEYLETRTWAYHLTAPQNIEGIQRHGALLSASSLAGPAEKAALTARRTHHIQMNAALIRDQLPLTKGSIEFAPGFTFEQLLELLNSLVFFWPGGVAGREEPIKAGLEHFKRYQRESPVILRARASELFANNTHGALFCRYNSGAPRSSHGKKSPRGPQTFVSITEFPGTASEVIELAFRGIAVLPASTKVAYSLDGRWDPLFKV